MENEKIKAGVSRFCGILQQKTATNCDFRKELQSMVDKGTAEYICGDNINREELQTLFVDGFINSIYPDSSLLDADYYKQISRYTVPVNKTVAYSAVEDQNIKINVTTLDFYFFPFDIVIFILNTDNSGKTLAELQKQNLLVKLVNFYDGNNISSDFLELFRLPALYSGCSGLFEKACVCTGQGDDKKKCIKQIFHNIFVGNKFYLFQLEQLENPSDDICKDGYTVNHLLYEITNYITPGASCNPADNYCPSKEYFDTLCCENTISVYHNWKAMGVSDSFCVLCEPSVGLPDYGQWTFQRFMIYLNVLYVKTYLVNINMKYQRMDVDAGFEKDFLEFDKLFNLHTISYNFLPQMIYEKLRYIFEVDDFSGQVREKISRYRDRLELENDKKERRNEKWMNNILFVVAVLAISSALNDGFEFAGKLGFSYTVELAWIVSGIVALFLLVFVVVMLLNYFINRKNKK